MNGGSAESVCLEGIYTKRLEIYVPFTVSHLRCV